MSNAEFKKALDELEQYVAPREQLRTAVGPGIVVATSFIPVMDTYETMIFVDGRADEDSVRHHEAFKAAAAAHARAVEAARNVMSKLVTVQNGKQLATCGKCGKLVRLNKPLFGSMHFCEAA